ncbi:hypothetical protein H5410_033895 [Solanum commersonii]|uniref:Uncharacterized protein n=1 Tax=Solanum commersonii TaxID=4109 RepID=A0A9J5YRL4_SOLCO|nr:hypothetical protein H5410_033895 [Solanum commersonii]
MKNLLLILLLVTFSNSWLSEASSAPEPVLDINGKILRTHTTYYIVPTNRENGGLSVETIGNETCQLGVHVRMSSINAVWQLEECDPSTGKYFVNVGGVDGNPGSKTIRNWFKIEKYGHGYKFVYCPSVCTYCKVICKDVGVYMINEQNRLALSDVPLVTYDCRHSTMWQLEKYDGGRSFINVGPKVRRNNWFRIEKYGQGYKFVYCKVICKDVGVVMVNGREAFRA